MKPLRWWRRLAELDPVDRRLLAEAAVLLLVVRVALRVCSLVTLQRVLARRRPLQTGTPVPVDRIVRAVRAAAARLGPTTCLMDALTTWAMLERRGHPAGLRFGVRRNTAAGRRLDSHAWVECDGRVVVGDTELLAEYVILVPADSDRSPAPGDE